MSRRLQAEPSPTGPATPAGAGPHPAAGPLPAAPGAGAGGASRPDRPDPAPAPRPAATPCRRRAAGSALRAARAAAVLLAGALLAATAPDDVDAQQQRQRPGSEFHASPYLPLDHWANDILDHWIHTGRIDNLSPLTRPWRRMDVARAIRHVAEARPYAYEEGWLSRLRREFRHELDRLRGLEESAGRVRGRFEAGGRYMSQTHRDPLRPELEGEFSEDQVLDRFWFDVSGRAGPVVGGVSVGRDRLLVNDAQFPDGRVVEKNDFILFDEQAIRFDEGYLELQSEHASLFFGRMNRNWGLPGLDGFIRSDYPYSYEEIGYRVGTDDVFLIGSVSSFTTDFRGDTTRFFTTHRLEVRPAEELVLSLSEASIHGGPDQQLDLRLVNPVGVWQIVTDRQQNTVGQFDAWWRPARGLALYGSVNLDATNSIGSSKEIDSCCQIGGSLGLELPGLVRGWRFRVQGTALQSLVYRTRRPWEEWSHRGIGLGWDKVDLYLVTLEAEWLERPGLVLKPRLDVQVKGEGTFRGRLRPPKQQLPTFPNILVGEAETTVRTALAGRWHPTFLDGWGLDLEWDLGLNVVEDFEHEAGDDRTAFVGEVKAVIQTPEAVLGLD